MTLSICQHIDQHIKEIPDKTALIVDNAKYTYAELGGLVSCVSSQFIELGIKRQDKVGVLLPNSAEFVVVLLALANIGAVIVPHHTDIPGESLYQSFRAAQVSHIVSLRAQYDDLSPHLNPLLNEMSTEESGCWITVGGEAGASKALDFESNFIVYNLGSFPVDIDEPYILTMTSGSTGEPKPIALSQAVKVARARAAVELYGITAEEIILAATPLYHSLAERLVLLPLMFGATACVLSGFTPRIWLEAVEKNQVSFTIAVSSQLAQIIPLLGAFNLESLRCVVSSSERLDLPLKESLLEHLDCEFHECYGASEVAVVSNLEGSDQHAPLDSVGKAIPGVDIKILDSEGKECAEGQVGEIACQTPMLFSGYFLQPERTREAMKHGYFRTGDLGKLDANGYLYFLGRKKDLVITGGINIYPKDIENVLLKHASVGECAVVGLEDDNFGEIPVAIVALNMQDQSIEKKVTEKQLLRFAMKYLGGFQLPHKIIFVDTLPKNAMGKILKRQIKADLENEGGATA